MKYEIGFIGAGNMGGALLEAAVKSLPADKITVYEKDRARGESVMAKTGCALSESASELASESRYIVIAVKPNIVASVAKEIGPVLRAREDAFTVVSIAAGVTAGSVQDMLGGGLPIIRIMPNTPAAVGEGMILLCGTGNVTEEMFSDFADKFRAAGRFDRIDEKLIDAGSGVSGCGPAYAYMFIEALADGGVACGLSRQAAIQYAAQMVLGSAKMVLESGEHPEVLKDRVCSPGGTTIQGVRALEKGGFRSAVIEAVIASYEKNFDLAK